MLLFNAVVLSVIVMLVLSVARVHVVISLFVASLVGGLVAGMGISGTMVAFQEGLAGGAKIALSYALLGAFAMAVAHSGLPQLLANWLIGRIENKDESASRRAVRTTTMLVLGGITAMAVMSQNLIPVHIAFIPLVVPPLLIVMSRLQLDRRAVACAITFGLVTTYMFLPLGFGRVFLHDILYANIEEAGLDVSQVPATQAMGIPALGMLAGLLIAVFVTYRKPRVYRIDTGGNAGSGDEVSGPVEVKPVKVVVALIAVLACFAVQTFLTWTGSEADPLLVGALIGLLLFMATRVVTIAEADDVEGAIAAVHALRPDVVLLDVHLPGGNGGGGAEVVASCHDVPETRFLALSVSDASDDVVGVIRAGARGYVTKAISTEDLAQAVRRVAAGDAAFSPRLAGFVLDAFGAGAGEVAVADSELDRLSTREREVMRLIARGYTYKECASELFISVKTVETHVSAVLRKLQLSNRNELTRWAVARRIV